MAIVTQRRTLDYVRAHMQSHADDDTSCCLAQCMVARLCEALAEALDEQDALRDELDRLALLARLRRYGA
jgi:hypothetical protein